MINLSHLCAKTSHPLPQHTKTDTTGCVEPLYVGWRLFSHDVPQGTQDGLGFQHLCGENCSSHVNHGISRFLVQSNLRTGQGYGSLFLKRTQWRSIGPWAIPSILWTERAAARNICSGFRSCEIEPVPDRLDISKCAQAPNIFGFRSRDVAEKPNCVISKAAWHSIFEYVDEVQRATCVSVSHLSKHGVEEYRSTGNGNKSGRVKLNDGATTPQGIIKHALELAHMNSFPISMSVVGNSGLMGSH